MKNKIKIITTVFFVLALTFAISAQDKPNADTPNNKSENQTKTQENNYNDLLTKLKKGDTSIDFKTLRFSYTKTDEYSPYGMSITEKNKLFDALDAKKYKEAINIAEKELETNYVEMNSHFVAFISHKELGNKAKADWHRTIFAGLVSSIIDGKDGKTSETAFEVICVPEEYVLLSFLGLRRTKQALINKNGSKFDVLSVTDPETNKSFDLYFNVDVVFEGYGKMFK